MPVTVHEFKQRVGERFTRLNQLATDIFPYGKNKDDKPHSLPHVGQAWDLLQASMNARSRVEDYLKLCEKLESQPFKSKQVCEAINYFLSMAQAELADIQLKLGTFELLKVESNFKDQAKELPSLLRETNGQLSEVVREIETMRRQVQKNAEEARAFRRPSSEERLQKRCLVIATDTFRDFDDFIVVLLTALLQHPYNEIKIISSNETQGSLAKKLAQLAARLEELSKILGRQITYEVYQGLEANDFACNSSGEGFHFPEQGRDTVTVEAGLDVSQGYKVPTADKTYPAEVKLDETAPRFAEDSHKRTALRIKDLSRFLDDADPDIIYDVLSIGKITEAAIVHQLLEAGGHRLEKVAILGAKMGEGGTNTNVLDETFNGLPKDVLMVDSRYGGSRKGTDGKPLPNEQQPFKVVKDDFKIPEFYDDSIPRCMPSDIDRIIKEKGDNIAKGTLFMMNIIKSLLVVRDKLPADNQAGKVNINLIIRTIVSHICHLQYPVGNMYDVFALQTLLRANEEGDRFALDTKQVSFQGSNPAHPEVRHRFGKCTDVTDARDVGVVFNARYPGQKAMEESFYTWIEGHLLTGSAHVQGDPVRYSAGGQGTLYGASAAAAGRAATDGAGQAMEATSNKP